MLDCLQEPNDRLWSNEFYKENFDEAYTLFQRSIIKGSTTGIAQLYSNVSVCSRFLHWEAIDGMVCLQELCNKNKLINSSVFIRLGASPLLSISIHNFPSETNCGHNLEACFAQKDGNIHIIQLQSDNSLCSVLENLVLAREGRPVNLPSFHLVKSANDLSRIPSAIAPIRCFTAVVETLPLSRDILSAEWVNSDLLLFGLTGGDILSVQISKVDNKIVLREQLLKDKRITSANSSSKSGLQALWSGLIGATAMTSIANATIAPDNEFNHDTIAVASIPEVYHSVLKGICDKKNILFRDNQDVHSMLGLAVARNGELRLWDVRRNEIIMQDSIDALFDGMVGGRNYIHQRHYHQQQHVEEDKGSERPSKTVCLQDSVARLVLLEPNQQRQQLYCLAAVAVQIEEESSDDDDNIMQGLVGGIIDPQSRRTVRGGGGEGKKGVSTAPWQLLLLATASINCDSDSSSAFQWGGSNDTDTSTMKLIAKPILFPTDDVTNNSTAATAADPNQHQPCLVDMEVTVDAIHKDLIITTIWNTSSSYGSSNSASSVTVIGKVSIPLSQLQQQLLLIKQNSSNATETFNVVGRYWDELYQPPPIELVTHSAAIHRLQLSEEDGVILTHHLNGYRRDDNTTDSFMLAEERELKTTMMQRIFLPGRYRNQAVRMAYDELLLLLGNAVATADSADVVVPHSHSISTTTVTYKQLPFLVLKAILSITKSAVHCNNANNVVLSSILSGVVNGENSLQRAARQKQQQQRHVYYMRSLADSFTTFLSMCDIASSRLDALHSPMHCITNIVAVASTACNTTTTAVMPSSSTYPLMMIPVIARKGGAISWITDVVSTATAFPSTISSQRQASSLLAILTEYRITDRCCNTQQFAEVDCLMSKYFHNVQDPTNGFINSSQQNNSTSNDWILRYFSTLAASLQQQETSSIVPKLQRIVQSLCYEDHNSTTCFDLLLDMPLFPLSNRNTTKKNSKHHCNFCLSNAVLAVSSGHYMKQQLLFSLYAQLKHCKLVLLLLVLLIEDSSKEVSSSYVQLLHPSLHGAIRDIYIPKAINQLFYLSLLNWMNTLYPTSNAMLCLDAELADILPLGSCKSGSSSDDHTKAVSVSGSSNSNSTIKKKKVVDDEQASVLDNFIEQFVRKNQNNNNASSSSSTTEEQFPSILSLLQSVWTALSPSAISSPLAAYLFQSGQYICLSRWAAVVGTTITHSNIDTSICFMPAAALNSAASSLFCTQFLPALARCRIQILRLTAEYYELLRKYWWWVQLQQKKQICGNQLSDNTNETATENMQLQIKAKAHFLLQVSQELSEISQSIRNSRCVDNAVIETASDGSSCTAVMTEDRDNNRNNIMSSSSAIYDGILTFTDDISYCLRTQSYSNSLNRSTTNYALQGLAVLKDALLSDCLEDNCQPTTRNVTNRSSSSYSLFAALIVDELRMNCSSSISPTSSVAAVAMAVKQVCLTRTADLCDAIHIACISDVMELIERSQVLLNNSNTNNCNNHRHGAGIIIQGAVMMLDCAKIALNNYLHKDTTKNDNNDILEGSYPVCLMDEMHSAWFRVFEYSLLLMQQQQSSRDVAASNSSTAMYGQQALNAILHISELQEHRQSSRRRGQSVVVVTWRECLTSLVQQACTHGQLAWLCTIHSFASASFSLHNSSNNDNESSCWRSSPQQQQQCLGDAIANVLEVLAATLELPLTINSRGSEAAVAVAGGIVNYYECYLAYQMSRKNYRDTARVMYALIERIDDEKLQLTMKDGKGVRHQQSVYPDKMQAVLYYLSFQIGALATAINCLNALPTKEQSFLLKRQHQYHQQPSIEGKSSLALKPSRMQVIYADQLHALWSYKCCCRLLICTLLKKKKDSSDKSSSTSFSSAEMHSLLELLSAHHVDSQSHDGTTSSSSNIQKLSWSLCNEGQLQDAISLAAGQLRCRSSDDGNFTTVTADTMTTTMEIPIITLARECARLSSSSVDNNNSINEDPYNEDNYLKYPMQQPNICNKVSNNSKSSGSYYWHMLTEIVRKLDDDASTRDKSSNRISDTNRIRTTTAGSSSRHWHALAVRAALSYIQNDTVLNNNSIGSNDNKDVEVAVLPRHLIDSFIGIEQDKHCHHHPSKTFCGGDHTTLLYLLVEFNQLEVACDVACRILNVVATTATMDSAWLSYNAFDNLIAACQSRLKYYCDDHTTDTTTAILLSQQNRLLRCYDSLRSALEQHFSLLLLSEMKPNTV